MKILSKRQILMLHSALVAQSGGLDGVRDEGLLDSALNTPFQTVNKQLPLSICPEGVFACHFVCDHWGGVK